MKRLTIEELNSEYVNKKFGFLTVISVFRDDKNSIRFRCRCDCGNIKDIKKKHILAGSIISCGCYKKSAEFSNKQKEYFINNPNASTHLSNIREALSASNRFKLLSSRDCSELLSVIHKDYINDLLLGNIKSYDSILTKCPLCGNYSEHAVNNVLRFGTLAFKRNHQPLCSTCARNRLSSNFEQDIENYISTFYNGECIRNSKSIIPPLELDLYYPEKHIAIEFNGNYWHSDRFKENDYHYNKFRLCYDNHIILVSIFELFWEYNSNSIKSYVYDLFNGKPNSLSMLNDHVINNNYPPVNILDIRLSNNYIEDCYNFNNNKVYTCGYTEI